MAQAIADLTIFLDADPNKVTVDTTSSDVYMRVSIPGGTGFSIHAPDLERLRGEVSDWLATIDVYAEHMAEISSAWTDGAF